MSNMNTNKKISKEQRIEIAKIYSKNLSKVDGETKKETATIVLEELGRIEKEVFWMVVDIVRDK